MDDLTRGDFLTVVRLVPLVSIDLLVKDQHGRYLLGKRVNDPARDFYFVPGGRIHKNQTQKEAFESTSQAELGRMIPFETAFLRGVFDHFYPTNPAGMKGSSTQYVVLAFEVTLHDINLEALPLVQHSEWIFVTPDVLTARADVHENTKLFFQSRLNALNDVQYQIVAARRQNYDNLLWQTPMVSLTAQAFLLTIALGAETFPSARLLAAFLSLLAALASLQLMSKHRHMELLDSQLLERHEAKNNVRFAVISGQERVLARHPSWIAGRSSYKVWLSLLGAFAVSSMTIMVTAIYLLSKQPTSPHSEPRRHTDVPTTSIPHASPLLAD